MTSPGAKKARPKNGRVQGIDSLVEDLTLVGTGGSLEIELGLALTENPKLTRSIFGASSIELTVFDPERRLLRHSLVSEKWDCELDGMRFRYPGGLSKSGDTLTLTLEDRWIAMLREKKGPKRAVRGDGPHQMTRAEFIKGLVEEACGKGLRFYCPQLHRVQPIKSSSDGKRAKREAKENRGKGLGDVVGLEVKGSPATKAQIAAGERAVRAAQSFAAPFRVQLALIVALMEESVMGELSPNWLQIEPESVSGFAGDPNDLEESVDGFLNGYESRSAGAIAYYRNNPSAKAYEIAQAVQRSSAGKASNGKANYGPREAEAREWVEAFDGGAASEDIEVTTEYEFVVRGKQRGEEKAEDYWSAIKRLAKDVRWRAFVVGDVFYYLPEPELLQGMVRLAIDGKTPGVENVDFEYDGNNPVTEIDIEARVQDGKGNGQWKVPPGAVVTLADHGPASIGFGDAPVKKDAKGNRVGVSSSRNARTGEGKGRYIVSSIEAPLADDPAQRTATIKAHKPTSPLPEPANKERSISGVSAGTSGNKTVERMLDAMEVAVGKKKPYVWGGADPDIGVDCSGAVSYALIVGGFLEERTTTQGLASFGEAGPGQWITVYDHANTGDPHSEHCAIEIAGIVFESGGGSENNNPNGGLGKVTSGVEAFLGQFEIKRHPKGF